MSDQTSRTNEILRMPAVFGPTPGPRQAPTDQSYDQSRSPLKNGIYAMFATEHAALTDLLPTGFTLRGDPRIVVEFSQLQEIAWLAGRGYNMLTLRVPVYYENRDQLIEGWFQPICWENMADPIISGREELGWSKIFADLKIISDTEDKSSIKAQWDGFEFMELHIENMSEAHEAPLTTAPIFHQKIIPRTGSWGEVDVNYITMTPAGGSASTLINHTKGSARIKFNQATWEQMPTQSHIIAKLTKLSMGQCLDAGMIQTRGGKDLSDQVRLK